MTVTRTSRAGLGELPAPEETDLAAERPAKPAALDAFTPMPRVNATGASSVVNGVTIISHGAVPKAVEEAQRIVCLLTLRPDIAKALGDKRVTLVIIPLGTKMTDLPEFAELRGKKTFDGRQWDDVRGSGGLSSQGRIVVGVAEENLAGIGETEYPKGYSIAMHELAHAIQNYALPQAERKRITGAFEAREAAKGPWTESYGSSNEQEYFAQLTNAWFGLNAGMGNNGAGWVRENDPVMAEELDRLYGSDGRAPVKPSG